MVLPLAEADVVVAVVEAVVLDGAPPLPLGALPFMEPDMDVPPLIVPLPLCDTVCCEPELADEEPYYGGISRTNVEHNGGYYLPHSLRCGYIHWHHRHYTRHCQQYIYLHQQRRRCSRRSR